MHARPMISMMTNLRVNRIFNMLKSPALFGFERSMTAPSKVPAGQMYLHDNVRIGMNSRLDTIQAAILQVKLRAFDKEVECVNEAARHYTELLNDKVKTPVIPEGFGSSWAQYTIQLPNEQLRNRLQVALKEAGIPSMVYYPKPMHLQSAFNNPQFNCEVAERLCSTVLSLPIHPYIESSDIEYICSHLIALL